MPNWKKREHFAPRPSFTELLGQALATGLGTAIQAGAQRLIDPTREQEKIDADKSLKQEQILSGERSKTEQMKHEQAIEEIHKKYLNLTEQAGYSHAQAMKELDIAGRGRAAREEAAGRIGAASEEAKGKIEVEKIGVAGGKYAKQPVGGGSGISLFNAKNQQLQQAFDYNMAQASDPNNAEEVKAAFLKKANELAPKLNIAQTPVGVRSPGEIKALREEGVKKAGVRPLQEKIVPDTFEKDVVKTERDWDKSYDGYLNKKDNPLMSGETKREKESLLISQYKGLLGKKLSTAEDMYQALQAEKKKATGLKLKAVLDFEQDMLR